MPLHFDNRFDQRQPGRDLLPRDRPLPREQNDARFLEFALRFVGIRIAAQSVVEPAVRGKDDRCGLLGCLENRRVLRAEVGELDGMVSEDTPNFERRDVLVHVEEDGLRHPGRLFVRQDYAAMKERAASMSSQVRRGNWAMISSAECPSSKNSTTDDMGMRVPAKIGVPPWM